MATRITLTLTDAEAEALARLAYDELRDPREQARLILREGLIHRGRLKASSSKSETEQEDESHDQ